MSKTKISSVGLLSLLSNSKTFELRWPSAAATSTGVKSVEMRSLDLPGGWCFRWTCQRELISSNCDRVDSCEFDKTNLPSDEHGWLHWQHLGFLLPGVFHSWHQHWTLDNAPFRRLQRKSWTSRRRSWVVFNKMLRKNTTKCSPSERYQRNYILSVNALLKLN